MLVERRALAECSAARPRRGKAGTTVSMPREMAALATSDKASGPRRKRTMQAEALIPLSLLALRCVNVFDMTWGCLCRSEGLQMLTPSGPFHLDRKIYFSMSDFYPGTCVHHVLTGLLSFMLSDEMTTGSVGTSSDSEKRH
ncbi:hypothetical protein BKA93DRAFT_764300 [Sparassis latifolia]